jgi:hypothetical protein
MTLNREEQTRTTAMSLRKQSASRREAESAANCRQIDMPHPADAEWHCGSPLPMPDSRRSDQAVRESAPASARMIGAESRQSPAPQFSFSLALICGIVSAEVR